MPHTGFRELPFHALGRIEGKEENGLRVWAHRILVDGASLERCAGTPPGTEASCKVSEPMRESQKQTGVKYAQFSLVGISNMLVDVGALNLLLLVGPTRSPELLVLYNVGALVLAIANSYLLNTLWTFKDQARHDAKQAGMFTAQGLLNVAVGSALLWLAAHGLMAYTDLSP